MSSEVSDGWTIGFRVGVSVADACDSGTSRESCVRSVTGEDVTASGTSRSHSDTIVTGAKTVHLWSSSEVVVVLAVLVVMAVLLFCHAWDSSNGDPVTPRTIVANNAT